MTDLTKAMEKAVEAGCRVSPVPPREANKIITAALSALEAEEWVLVPEKATPEMVKAYGHGLRDLINSVPAAEREIRWKAPRKGKGYLIPETEKCAARYSAMLAARPRTQSERKE